MIVWLASYPRSGNTLLRTILKQSFGLSSYSLYDDVEDIGTNREIAEAVGHVFHNQRPEDFYKQAAQSAERTLVKTHDAPPDDAPAIYVVRDGRAVSVSYARYLDKIFQASNNLTDVILGDVLYGRWGAHLDSWNPGKRPNTLLLRYEDMVAGPQEHVEKIAAFLGVEPLSSFRNDFDSLRTIYPAFYGAATQRGWGADVSRGDAALFWSLNAEHMGALGYDRLPGEGTATTGEMLEHLRTHVHDMRAAAETAAHEARQALKTVEQAAAERLELINSLQAELATDRAGIFERAAEERLELINQQAAEIAETRQTLDQAKATADLAKRQAIALSEAKERETELHRVLEKLSQEHDALLAVQTDELQHHGRTSTEAAATRALADQQAVELEAAQIGHDRLARKLDDAQQLARQRGAEIRKHVAALQADRLRRQADGSVDGELVEKLQAEGVAARQLMWQARAQARQLELAADRQRWQSWRSRLVYWAAKWGRWFAEGILCQVFPPLPGAPPLKVTVVTPVFNNADTIRETIESVLNQESADFEYIIIDGGSTDGSVEIIREYENRLALFISEPDFGMYDAVAKGFLHATGDILAYLNADDVYEHGALSRVVHAFQTHPRSQVIYFEDSVTVNGWRFPNRPQRYVDFHTLFRGHILYQDGVFFTRRAYNFVGGLNQTMRAAGDWELWTRLAYRFRFKRLPGHVSSFRIRQGQLSQDMAFYHAEIEQARPRLRGTIPRVEWLLRLPRYHFNRLRNLLLQLGGRLSADRRLFFQMDFAEMPPPPGHAPDFTPRLPKSPIDAGPPSELLFSTRDTRFGDELISYVYYHRDDDVVSYYPPLSRDELKDLYARTYNTKHPAILLPPEGSGSPYRNFRATRRSLRWIQRLVLPNLVRRVASRLNVLSWPDRSLEEILTVRGRRVGSGAPVKFLDIGCFDGKLLDRLASLGNWETYGLEPNAVAAEQARAKGHKVWTAEVEDALELLPGEQRFDLIFLGQTIEHFNDPLAAIVQLSQLLSEHGEIILSTPNLNSAQIDMFGPTWSHWHAPYHRHLFSPKSLGLLADRAGMRMTRYRTWSHPSWSWLSQKLHKLGLGASVPHGIVISAEDIPKAESLAILARLLYDWRGKGDYIYAVFRKK